MEINLTYKGRAIGSIYPSLASHKLGEIQGYFVPNEEYQKIRKHINKYSEIFNVSKANSFIDRILNKMLKRKYKSLKDFYSKIGLSIDNTSVSTNESKIEIHDHLARTNLGNPIIGIIAWNLKTKSLDREIDCYTIFKIGDELGLKIEIKKGDEIIFEY